MALRTLDLCAGYGGFSLGLRLAVPGARTVCYVEREAFAACHLVKAMEAGWLDQAPIWGDLTTFGSDGWRGAVDLVCAGLPCQPHSVAGKQQGLADGRDLTDHFVRIVGECAPAFAFIENVPGYRKEGLPRLLGGLAKLGFDAEWGVLGAADIGANHLRKRMFILATHPERLELWRQSGGRGRESGREAPQPSIQGKAGTPPDAHSLRLKGLRGKGLFHGERPSLGHHAHGRDREIPDAHSPRLPKREGEPGHPRSEFEAAVGKSWWTPEPPVCGVDDGSPDRVDRLRMLGNGVVPLAVAYAWRTLYGRLAA